MNGKNWSQALSNCRKSLSEAIFWLLFTKIVEKHELPNNLKILAEGFLGNINKESRNPFSTEPDVKNYVQQSNDNDQLIELDKLFIQYTNHV